MDTPAINIENNLPGAQQAVSGSCTLCGLHLQIMHDCFIQGLFVAVKEYLAAKHEVSSWATWILYAPSVLHNIDCNRIYIFWSAELAKRDPHFSEEMRASYIKTYDVWRKLKTHYAPLVDHRFFFDSDSAVASSDSEMIRLV